METAYQPAPEPIQVRLVDVLSLVVATPVAAIAVSFIGLARPWSAVTIAWMAAASAGVLGVPVVAWCLERGHRSVVALTLVAGVAGAVPPFVAMAAGTVGLLWRFGWSFVSGALAYGAPVPTLGVIEWPRFLYAVLLAMLAGGLAGATLALVRRLTARA